MKGATTSIPASTEHEQVSIHAPMKGATRGLGAVDHEVVVSIHAPMKGATPSRSRPAGQRRCFNPRPHEGGDGQIYDGDVSMTAFQSTPP